MTPARRYVLLAIVGLGCSAPSDRRPPEVGEVVPQYAALSLDGDTVDVEGLRGKVVLLNVWATWCAPCREEIPFLQSLYDANRDRGFEVIGVSTDARGQDDEIRGFMREFGMTYPVWRDPDERVQTLFFALGVPSSYLIDRDGVLRWKRLGIVRENDSTFTRALETALSGT